MKIKQSEIERIKKAIGQHVLVTYLSQGKQICLLKKLVDVDFQGIIVENPTGYGSIRRDDIIDLKIKNLSFISPRTFFFNTKEEKNNLNILMDAITTKTIERMKNLDNYTLLTRYATFTKRSFLEKKRHKRQDFEMTVFEWIKTPQNVIHLCPLALLNNNLLLAIYMKRFMLFKNNLNIVFVDNNNDIQDIIDFIFEHNEKLTEQKGRSLRYLAEELL